MGRASISEIRAAIASEDYVLALRLWNGYTSEVRDSIERRAFSEEDFANFRGLAEWGRTALQCSRAHLLDQLNSRYVAGIYASQSGVSSKSG
jgi:hypothetical protein